jgi:hypothetical protein
MKLYVASSWRNDFQQPVVQLLRKYGHEVYDFKNPSPGEKGFSWSEIDPNWRQWSMAEYIEKLEHPISIKGYNRDFEAMKWADACVLVLPCGRSAHTEAGWFKGAGKKVFAYVHSGEPELMYKLFDKCYFDLSELIFELRELVEPVREKSLE